jgi:predicted DNA-binding transcriptional regulator YafY
MFGGEEETVRLQFDNSLVNTVIDRFGKDVTLDKVDDSSFSIRINVAISSTFFAWIAQFGNKVKILSPESVIEKYQNYYSGDFRTIQIRGGSRKMEVFKSSIRPNGYILRII